MDTRPHLDEQRQQAQASGFLGALLDMEMRARLGLGAAPYPIALAPDTASGANDAPKTPQRDTEQPTSITNRPMPRSAVLAIAELIGLLGRSEAMQLAERLEEPRALEDYYSPYAGAARLIRKIADGDTPLT